jgi:hypothetical protein
VFAAWFTLNGNGEMTGTTWVQESGLLEGPVAITSTHSVGVVRDAVIQWGVSKENAVPWGGMGQKTGLMLPPDLAHASYPRPKTDRGPIRDWTRRPPRN